MGREIERKFLLKNDNWRGLAQGTPYRQGYLNAQKGCTVRVRIMGGIGVITIKGPAVAGVRPEYEYEIPVSDANEMLDNLCLKPLIEKIRYKIPYGSFTWEVDEFEGLNAGLIVAEIELAAVDQKFPRPDWIGAEVTDDPRYYNASLVRTPYKDWPKPQ